MKYSKYSAIIIGTGISGLYLAYRLLMDNDIKDGILLISKSDVTDCNSKLAQGGIVGVMPSLNKLDSISSHIKDTIKAGSGLNDFNTVKYISENSENAIKSLIEAGVEFDKNEDGTFDFTLEAAHSIPRILHFKDKTGEKIETALFEKIKNSDEIEIYENTMAVEILSDYENTVRGILAFRENTGEYETILSNAVIIATGGTGQLYKHTTSRPVATGDGIYLANSVGAKISDMEFIQFHPTALAIDNAECMPLVSEAVRGEGAKLVNIKGERFISKYDPASELAPRDVVARAIFDELKNSGEKSVYLDISDIGVENFKKRFPSITEYCEKYGVDLDSRLIPVSPAAHYLMGGIEVNLDFETTVKNLYAVGEASRTGLHGANRLASNSLLECVVSAEGLYRTLNSKNLTPPKNYDEKIKNLIFKYENEEQAYIENPETIKTEIQDIMWENAGILRDEKALNKALFRLDEIKKKYIFKKTFSDFKSYEVRNMLEVAQIIIKAALNRKNSKGAHFRADSLEYTPCAENEVKNEILVK